jgi:hypothetical protein
MKINEVTHKQLDEGPLDFAKKVGAGIKGLGQGFAAAGQPKQPVKPGANDLETAINTVNAKPNTGILGKIGGAFQGAKAGYQTAGDAQAQSAKIKTIAGQTLQKWAKYNQNVKTSTGADATPDQATAWFTQFIGKEPASPPPAGNNPVQIQQWLTKEVAGYMAQKELPEMPDISQLTKDELLQLKQRLQAA